MTVLFLPGQGCRFWVHGHCWLPEAVNPGWDATLACRVLAALLRTYDGALAAQEAGVPGALAAWSRWGDSVLLAPWQCRDFAESGEEPGMCRFLRGSVCVLRLPPCQGRCSHYRLCRP